MLGLESRTLAFGVLGILLLIGVPALLVLREKRRRRRLRQRGIKRYGH